ncbi:MAG: hypothetical protein MUE60_14290, partial [Candidatus Eisenbacteria bacterium]|nr:hypothetical protein [Candidatus Eisenbacteria bacterium]
MGHWRVVASLIVLLAASPPSNAEIGVRGLWLDARGGPGELASTDAPHLIPGADSLAWLRMDQSAWRKHAGSAERAWLDAAAPILYRLGSERLGTYLGSVAAVATWRQWRETAIRKKTAAQQQTRGLLKDIELPVKLPGLLGHVVSGKAGLRVSGRQRLELGGKSSYQVGQVADPNRSNSKFPQLHMEQELRVSLKGNVGDKISVLVDHDSAQRSSDKNKIRIRYEGTEDEIL